MKKSRLAFLILLAGAATSSQAFWWLYQPSPVDGNKPIPRPANPNNNPWLNYPATYGSATPPVQHGKDIHPDMMKNIDRYMKLSQAERTFYADKATTASLARGKALFASSSLGSTGLTCVACHPDGKTAGGSIGMGDHEVPIPSLVGVSRRYPKFKAANDRVITQTEMQNNCIVMFLKGQPLVSGTQEAADLTFYVSRFTD